MPAAAIAKIPAMTMAKNWVIGALLSAAIVAAALTAAARWQSLAEQKQARQWIGQVGRLRDEDAAELVRSLGKRDSLALPALAVALTDRRPAVSAAAQDAIGNLATDWRHLPAEESVPRLTELSSRLADGYAQLHPQQQRFVRQLAESMLRWPLEDADFPADDLVAACERILAAPPPDAVEDNPTPPQVASRPKRPEIAPQLEETAQPAPVVELPDLMPPQPLATPGGDATSDPQPQPVEPRQFIQPRVDAVPK